MAELFSRSFHCLWVPCRNLPPIPSERLRVSSPFPFPKRWVGFTHHTHMLAHSTSPSSSSVPEDDVHIISSTQCSDGSFVFRFGSASEIREKIGELEQEKPVHEGVEEGGARALPSVEKLSNEVGHNLVEETESSSSIVVVGVADQNPQLLVNEKESFVLDDDPETPVINDSQKFDRLLRLDSVEDGDGHHGITSEDVVAESSVVPGVSEEESQVDSHKEVVVLTVCPEKDMFSDPSSGASGEGEEKEEADKDHGVDRATNRLTGGVDADLSELLPVSTSLEPEQVVNGATHNLTDGVDADSSEPVPVSTSLESEQVVNGAIDNLIGGVDADSKEPVPVSTSLESEQVFDSATDNLTGVVDADASESVPTSTSLESEQVLDSATDHLTGGVDADSSEPVPTSTSLESEQVLDRATDNLTGGVDSDLSESVPTSTSLDSEQVLDSATDNLTGGVDADSSEPVPTSTSLESEQVLDSATDHLTGGVDADSSEPVPISTSLESEQVLDSATDNLTGVVDSDSSEPVPVSASLESEQVLDSATDNLTGGVDADSSEPVPTSTSLESEQVLDSATDHLTGGVDADSSELVPISTSLESKQVLDSATDNLTGVVDADSSEPVPTSTSLESEQVLDSATDNLTGGVDSDLSESVPTSTSLESEVHANYEETTSHIVDDSVDASKIGKSESLHDLVPSSDLENKIDGGNTERSDYGNISRITVPEMHSVEMASHGEKTSRTELFLVSGVAYLPHPSKALAGREDAYFISHQNWLAVADGVGQWSLEGGNTGLYIRELMEKCENIVSNYENISKIKPAEVLTRSAGETQTPGSSSLLVAYFDGQALHAANVGNTGFIIIRDGSIFKKSTVRFHEFSFPLQIVKGDDPSEIIEEYKIDLNDGDVIVFATNGLFDNLYEQEIASIISKSLQASLGSQEIAELLARRAQEVGRSTSTRSPFGDAAQAVGYVGYAGGKLDDVTVIVSLLQTK